MIFIAVHPQKGHGATPQSRGVRLISAIEEPVNRQEAQYESQRERM